MPRNLESSLKELRSLLHQERKKFSQLSLKTKEDAETTYISFKDTLERDTREMPANKPVIDVTVAPTFQ